MSDLHLLSATAAAALIARGELASEALVRDCLDRIALREPAVGAWEYLDPDHALWQARRRDRAPAAGPLHGIPVGIKDLIDTVDMPTGYGSAIYRGHRPVADAASVALLRRAGAVILGKTVTSEFATYFLGKTRNPHDPARSPGISSMGSAAAVADAMVPMALGTQTGGSIIRPAAFCGALGYKPSFGLINRAGVKPLAESLDTVGFFTRDAADAELFARVLTGRAEFGRVTAGPPRIGLCRTHAWDKASPDIVAMIEAARRRLAAAGASVTEVALPEACAELNEALIVVMRHEAARAFAFEYDQRRAMMSEVFSGLLDQGLAIEAEAYDAAQRLAVECRVAVDRLFGEVDLLMTPAAEREAEPARGPLGDSVFNRLWTLLHLPCVSLPAPASRAGLPLGLQLVGRQGGDATLLAATRWIEAQLGAA